MSRAQMLLLSLLALILLPAVCLVMAWFALRGNSRRFSVVALAFDCAGNAAMNGDYRETISSRAGRRWPRSAAAINWLFADPYHCQNATKICKQINRPRESK